MESWDELAARSRALIEAGDPDEAVDVARAAVEAAAIACGEDRRETAEALVALGHALTFAAELELAAGVLNEAIHRLGPDDHGVLAEALTALGLVHQAEDDLVEAERCLRTAIAHQEQAAGREHPLLARSWTDLARLTFQAGGRGEPVDALLRKAQEIIEAALSRASSEAERLDLRWDAWTVAGDLVAVRLVEERAEEAAVALRSALAHLEAFVATGGGLPEGIRDRSDPWLDALDEAGARGVGVLRARVERLTGPRSAL